MKNYYKIGVEAPMDYDPTWGEEVNSGFSMLYRGLSRGENHRDLYKSGITGACVGIDLVPHPSEQAMDVVGKTSIWEHPMDSFTNFMVDVAHLLLMLGGLYLIAGAIWGGPKGR